MANAGSVMALRAEAAAEEDGIRKGDYLLVRTGPSAPPGATVVAMVDGRITVRRLVRSTDGQAELLPVSPRLLPLALPAERAKILGPLVGVLRRRPGRHRTPATPTPPPAPQDPALGMIGSVLEAAAAKTIPSGRHATRIREMARDLRALRDCYVGTSVPRLREALLREARTRLEVLRGRLGAGR